MTPRQKRIRVDAVGSFNLRITTTYLQDIVYLGRNCELWRNPVHFCLFSIAIG
jgi:hypothetical protein